MSTDVEPDRLARLVAEAETAVASVKDPELRRVAFEKILEKLLGAESEPGRNKTSNKAKRATGSNRTGQRPAASLKKGPKGRVVELLDEGFFNKQRTIADVKAELTNRGHHIPMTSLSGPLQRLTRERRLRRQKRNGGKGAKGTYVYSNW